MEEAGMARHAFDLPDMEFEEYRGQEVLETCDGAFFDALDEMFGIVPRTDVLFDEPAASTGPVEP